MVQESLLARWRGGVGVGCGSGDAVGVFHARVPESSVKHNHDNQLTNSLSAPCAVSLTKGSLFLCLLNTHTNTHTHDSKLIFLLQDAVPVSYFL